MDSEVYNNYLVQKDLQDRSGQQQMAMYAPQMYDQMQQNQAVLVSETNPSKVVKKIVLNLQGLNEKPGGEIERWGEPKMNEKGISWATYLLESCINQNIILSHFDEKQIAKMMIQIGNSMTDDLTLNWKAYGIKNKTDLDIIEDTLLYNIWATLNRALGQNEKNWIGRISVENISGQSSMPKPKDGGFLSKFKL